MGFWGFGVLAFWGSTSSPHIGDVMMSLFFTLGSTVHDWGWPKNGPFWTKNGQTWQACQRSKVVQRGPKGTKMVNLSLFDHLGPRLGPSGPFWTISDKMIFLPQIDKIGFCRGASEQNINSCFVHARTYQGGCRCWLS